MNIKVLRQKRADLVREAQGIFDAASEEGNRGLSADEAARDDEITAELTELDAQIARAERQMERQRALGVVNDQTAAAAAAAGAPNQPKEQAKFKSLGEQMMAVALAATPGGHRDPRLTIAAGPSGLSEGISSDGGFLVQTDFVSELLQNTYTSGQITSRIRKISLGDNSNGIRINGVDETSRVNGSRWGGIQAYWSGEAQQFTATQPKFRQIRMELDKLTGLCYATDELLSDATMLQSWLMQAFSDEFVFKIEDAVLNGTGAGMPLGILNSGAVITVSKEGSQASGTILAANVYKMYARMPARNLNNAVWLCNQDITPQLWQLNTPVKNVAGTENVGGIPLLPEVAVVPPGVNGNPNGSLMGRPVIPVEYCATLGTPGDLILVDLTQYLAIDKTPMQSASSIHVRFLYDEQVFRFIYRFNGQPIWYAPMTPYKGSNTQSPYIVLQSR